MPDAENKPITPVYSQTEPNVPIALGEEPVALEIGGTSIEATASVTLQFAPEPRLRFDIPLTQRPSAERMTAVLRHMLEKHDDKRKKQSGEATLRLRDRNVSVKGFVVGARGGSHDERSLTWVPSSVPITVTSPCDGIVEAILHVFNLPDLWAHGEGTNGVDLKSARIRRVAFGADGWSVTITANNETKQACESLREQGGFIVTHMARTKRDDGVAFSSGKLEDVLNCVHHFLSFVLGRWAGVCLPIGVDREGNRVFEQWGIGQAASGRWNAACSWFNENHSEVLGDVFPGFYRLWCDQLWGPTLRHAVYWYVSANDRQSGIGLDAGLIPDQIALERLAWTYCVRDRKMISPEAFGQGGLRAADKLRLLASVLEIPTEFPPNLSGIAAKPGKRFIDVSDFVVRVRNAIVHPKEKSSLSTREYYEAWRLSLWILELVLLRLCGHRGGYANRLSAPLVGQIEDVPWATK